MPLILEIRMRRVLVVCLALAGAGSAKAQTPGPSPSQRATKFAFINSQELIQRVPGYIAADSTLNREIQGYRDEIQKLQQQLDSAVQALDQASIALSPAAKQARAKQVQGMQDRYTQRTSELNDRVQQRRRELFGPIEARVRAVIDGIRAEGNYAMIFDVASGGLISADPSLDITNRVLQRLQQAQ
jgi:outer membrane protein